MDLKKSSTGVSPCRASLTSTNVKQVYPAFRGFKSVMYRSMIPLASSFFTRSNVLEGERPTCLASSALVVRLFD